ncbi:hypothetical protein FGD67_15355 [Colwellia sp. M166]|uniref:Rap1a/Tai family immunity protein n=1 Tax=Colwellia sp. M166 TaxID=2583805 RepID=UPI00211E821B|nr:Rap1a/Tai family immunity protein [Colwellia sp. M166]UUO24448.1 hypothetical protein FGD67_15355 [Colwellia sp. M166]|tara:strand:+ start:11153 stop:11611 length:459 start_codon:yes stop_codon:yes gene_type:complete
MNNLKNLMHKTILVVLLLTSTQVLADFKSDIIASCSAYQLGEDKSAINACKLYIDGFIDSALLTEDAVIQSKAMIESQASEQSAYLKRAYQTRVSDQAFLNNHKDYQFCIPREYDRKVVVSAIAKSMDIKQLADKSLKEVLFETLIADFPCS